MDEEEDDMPWASPEVQANYEAALGRFLLAFNQLDNLLGEVTTTVLTRLGRADLVKACVEDADFATRLRFLDLLKHSTEGQGIASVPIADMKGIGGERNILTHGHFDQNPYDGSYRLVGRGKGQPPYYSADRIDGLKTKAMEAWSALRHAEAFYQFSEVRASSIVR